MATGASDGFFRSIFDGCLSGGDSGLNRRPYHKNCKCALHDKSRESKCYGNKVSYPIRRSWSESSLALMAHAPSGASGHTSPSCSPAEGTITRTQTQLVLCTEDESSGGGDLLICPCPRSSYKV